MKIRRQLFILQATTLGIVTAGSLGGWALSHWIGQGPRREAEQLATMRNHLAQMSFGIVGALPHTGRYLLSSPANLHNLLQDDIQGLRRFRAHADEHLAGLSLVDADQQLHRELETIRLLSVQLEQNLSGADQALRQAQQRGLPLDPARLQRAVQDPSIEVIRRHGDLLASLHNSVDLRYRSALTHERRAVLTGVIGWITLLLTAWVLGLLLAWRMGNRLLRPLIQLEQLMQLPPHQLGSQLDSPLFSRAPSEIASLSRSFQGLTQKVLQLLEELERQVRTDGLTGVGNRRHFETLLEQEWRRAARAHQPLSLLLLDVDHFKLYNDHYGHVLGDQCLQAVAGAIRSQARRSGDAVCRIGGEEFAVLLPATGAAEAACMATEILRQIDTQAIEHRPSPVAAWVTASIGVASATPTSGQNPKQLLQQADAALYKRKREGRHGVELATPTDGAWLGSPAAEQPQ